LARLLIEKYGANVNLQTTAGETPLIASAKRNRLELVQYLLSKNSDSAIYSKCALIALDYAILQGFYEVALVLF
jgi:ankyrin repeat protein